MRATCLAAFVFAAPIAQAATLRSETVTLTDSNVHLSDLFDGHDRDRIIGPAPEPGGRIVVESAQLGAIARQFSVDWRPAGTGDRVVMERPGRPFQREAVLDALRDALTVAGIPPHSDIETPTVTLPMVPPGDAARPDVTETAYDAVSGRFTALLSITAPGMTPFNARLSGHVQEMVEVEVATRRMAAGEVIGAGDLQLARLRVGLVRGEAVRLPDQAVGMAMRHPIGAGAPLLLADLGRPVVLQRGNTVQLQLNMPGLAITVQAVAMEPAAIGERTHVLNPNSRVVMEAEVTGPGQARVIAGSTQPLPNGAAVPRPSTIRVAVR